MVNFMEISTRSLEIVQLSLKDIYDLLSDDLLNCRDEEHVFNVVVRWVDHDILNRRSSMGKLLKAVRLGLLNTRVCILFNYSFEEKKQFFTSKHCFAFSRFSWSM